MLLDKKNIHFVGAGGIGMSGIASILLDMGYRVSGSDRELNNLTRKIETKGGRVYKGHSGRHLHKDVDVVVYSSSISRSNPEIVEARKRRLPVVQRAEVLGELFNGKKGIAVSGTHGKTTTTSLISVMLERSGYDPTVIIGGEVELFSGNAKSGAGEYVVAEADESDGSFLHLKPLYSVITNIEMEHMDYYKTLDEMIVSYAAFAGNLKEGGTVLYCQTDKNAKTVLKGFKGDTESFGLSRAATIYATDIRMEQFNTAYRCVRKGKALGAVDLKIPGAHNILNSLAAIGVGLRLGLPFERIADSIKDFKGTKRRFHLRAEADGVMLIDDYAHHPTEIRAVLDACRGWKDRRIIVIFQPHRYSRTFHLAEQFGACFKGADRVILTDIYPASERPIKGVSSKNIFDRVRRHGPSDVIMMKKEKIADHIMDIKRPGDMILVLGAGDIKNVADELSERLTRAMVHG